MLVRDFYINFTIMVTNTFISSVLLNIQPELPRSPWKRLIVVAATVAAGIILLQYPVRFPDGVILAFHGVSPALAGLYGGVWWGLGSAVPLAAFRMWMGGAGAVPGCTYILLVGLISGLLKVGGRGFSLPLWQIGWRGLVMFLVGNASLLMIPQTGLQYFKLYYVLITVCHVAALVVCVSVLRMRFESQRHLALMQDLAHVDHLTGLPNLRSFEETLAEVPALEPCCLLMVDVDHFKQVNDRFGHQAGDEALKQMAQVMRKAVRSTDQVFRKGGEEFAILMRGCTIDQAREVAERVRCDVARHAMQTPLGVVHTTVSGGLISLSAAAELAPQVAEADRLLYLAKASGRDRIVVAGSD